MKLNQRNIVFLTFVLIFTTWKMTIDTNYESELKIWKFQ